jgi:hypothetical protein
MAEAGLLVDHRGYHSLPDDGAACGDSERIII